MEILKQTLLSCLDDAFDGEAWHGPNLYGTLANLDLEQMTYDNTVEGFSVWQIALHCAYWKWYVRKLLSNRDVPAFQRSADDWPAVPDNHTLENWKRDIDFLVEEHRLLRQSVVEFPDNRLPDIVEGKSLSYLKHIYSVAAHDVYHTAQIRNMGVPRIK